MHKYSVRQSAKKTQHVLYFWKKKLFKDIKINSPMCQKRKYKKHQKNKYTNTAYDEMPIFLKSGLFRYIFRFSHSSKAIYLAVLFQEILEDRNQLVLILCVVDGLRGEDEIKLFLFSAYFRRHNLLKRFPVSREEPGI